jgi:iron complex outermembrane receptor protein
MRRLCVIVATAVVLCSLPAHASEQKLEEVVVTATKTRQAASEAPASVEVVKGEEMRKKSIYFPDQALKSLPGVFSERRGGMSSVSDSFAPLHLRGMPSASQSLVLLDGQPMNNYEGNIHWWAIPVENIDRIEVVKGPFSSLYGGGAMGGVVNIITDPVYSPLEVTYGYGSYNSRLISAGHGLSVGDVTYSIVFRSLEVNDPEQTSTTWSPGTNTVELPTADGGVTYLQGYTRLKASNDILSLGLTWDMTLDSSLDLKYSHADYKFDPDERQTYDGERLSSSYREHSTNTYIVSYRNSELENIEFLFNAGLTHNYRDVFIWNNVPGGGESIRPNSHYNAGLQSNITLGSHVLTLGTDWQQGKVSAIDESKTPNQESKGKLTTTGLFIQDQWDLTRKLSLYAGARYDHWRAHDVATNSSLVGYPVEISSKTESHVSPKLSVVYRPDELTTVRASAGESFRGPTLWEAFKYSQGNRGTSLPNPELDPETVRSYEVGFARNLFSCFDIGLTYFVNHFDDMIYQVDTTDVDGDGSDDYLYENVGKAKSRGYEASLGFRARDDLYLFANYTRMFTRVQEVDDPVLAAAIEGKEFVNIPEYTFNIGAEYDRGPVFTSLTVRFVGDSYRNQDNSDTINNRIDGNDPYSVVDLSLGYRAKNLEVKASVENCFDQQYWESYDINPGRTYFLTVTTRL